MTKPFGEDLWKNVQAISFGQDGEITAPVRADGKDGIRVGVDAVAGTPAASAPRRATLRERLVAFVHRVRA